MTQKTITYKDKSITTKFYYHLSDEKCDEIKQLYNKKPRIEHVYINLYRFSKGYDNISKVVDYYLKDLMHEVLIDGCKWTVKDVFEHNDLIRYYYAITQSNTNVYTDSNIMKNLYTAIRTSGKGVAKQPTNYPIESVDYILRKYNINNNYYDFSCGWSARMLSSIRRNINYFGTDPNYLLVEQLHKIKDSYKLVNKHIPNVDIRITGSEIFHSDWENKIGVAFTSPPYFNVEDYQHGEQSYKPGMEYTEWVEAFLRPTIQNVQRYLIDGGHILINIKDYKKYPMYTDSFNICKELEFNFVEELELDNIQRPTLKDTGLNTHEKIMVFRKGNAIEKKKTLLDDFFE